MQEIYSLLAGLERVFISEIDCTLIVFIMFAFIPRNCVNAYGLGATWSNLIGNVEYYMTFNFSSIESILAAILEALFRFGHIPIRYGGK